MEIKLNLKNEGEVVDIYQILRNERTLQVGKSCDSQDMIELLKGNEGNVAAKNRLRCEQQLLQIYHKKIQFIDQLIAQLEVYLCEKGVF